ncbi:MAG: OmpA family protein [Saprospiraceae bacterium]|nr:OmpA family protein [Saprospiraceae bacterium]MCB9327171.1 OmpA family protein [Lewinellaceae bacterium]
MKVFMYNRLMMLNKSIFILLFFVIFSNRIIAQDTIRINNPSFEDAPHKGTDVTNIRGWFDCGRIFYPNESPPDIHPGGFWGNNLPAYDGNTYLGMVVRDNESWESVSQRMSGILEVGKCYSFSIALAASKTYKSPTHKNQLDSMNFDTAIVLRIWGGESTCDSKILLAESDPVTNTNWKIYNFTFQPTADVKYITLEAFYKTPTLFPYNGNLLLDDASEIIQVPCPGDEMVQVDNKKYVPPHKSSRKNIKETQPKIKNTPTKDNSKSSKAMVINTIDKNKLKEGQTIRIEKLYFDADKAKLNENSHESLDEIVEFLNENPKIEIEVGGHTNGIPEESYCDRLSEARAKEVADYLVKKGIDSGRISYKGYGKKIPLASDKTYAGRLKNQRVEIKILKLG